MCPLHPLQVERRITLKVNEVTVQHSPRDKVAIVDLQHAVSSMLFTPYQGNGLCEINKL